MDRAISVVIPTFNRKELTDRAVHSVIASNPDLFEVVVVDDCGPEPYSFDATHNTSGVEVRVVRADVNRGPGLARKLGVCNSRGSIICFLDSDDTFEPGWPDAVLQESIRTAAAFRDGLFVSGMTRGASAVQARSAEMLARLPRRVQRVAVRLTTIAFNPFYTPATAMSKKLCQFLESGRYCEDYFTNAIAIFGAERISVLPIKACTISRSPGAPGGLSGMAKSMAQGEYEVRRAMLLCEHIPICYRALVPIGMAYSLARRALKVIVGWARKQGYYKPRTWWIIL